MHSNTKQLPTSNEDVISYAKQIWNDYNSYITFSASFFMLRSIAEFRPGESLRSKIIEGIIFAAGAAASEYGVSNNLLENYKYSVLPILGKCVFDKQLSGSGGVGVNLAISTATLGLVNYAYDSFQPKIILLPLATYAFSTINNMPKHHSVVASLVATVLDTFVIKENALSSWGLAGFALGQNLASRLDTQYKIPVAIAGSALGAGLSQYQNVVLDQLFTPDHFIASYDTISKIVDANYLNINLEKYLISAANMNLCMSIFGNQLVLGVQSLVNDYQAIGSVDASQKSNAYKKFITNLFFTYALKNLLPYLVYKIPMELISSAESLRIIEHIQDDFIAKKVVNEANFIQNSKSNYTIQSYLKDVQIISGDLKILDSIIFKIPKLAQLSNLDLTSYLGVGLVIMANIGGAKFFSYLTEMKQHYENEKAKCESYFDKVASNDKENAMVILQKSGLNFTLEKWSGINEFKHENLLFETIFSRSHNVGSFFYNDFIIKYMFQLFIGYLTSGGTLDATQVLLYERVLGFTSDAALFKTLNLSDLKKVDSANERLSELTKFFESNISSIKKINVNVDQSSEYIKISNLDFTRGDDERKIHISIKDLNLPTSKTYAVTGGNGSGKSSFTTLLKYVLDGIADSSFKVISGDITYPDSSIMMIPQKDYIPYKSNLLDVIYYPSISKSLNAEEEINVLHFINELKVFASPINHEDLYNIKESWHDLSGGQKKKLFMVKALLECPKILIMDETFGPLDPAARGLLMDQFKNSCLSEAISLIVWHQDKNEDGTSCVKDSFFDYELHSENQTFTLYPVSSTCEF